jgi:hypothetical protein
MKRINFDFRKGKSRKKPMSQITNHQPELTLQKVEYMQRLEAGALPPLWEFVDSPSDQVIQQIVSARKCRPLFHLTGFKAFTPEGQLLVELRNHAKMLLAIARKHLSEKTGP